VRGGGVYPPSGTRLNGNRRPADIGVALARRRDAQTHKRLMLVGSIALIGAAIARWPGVIQYGPVAFFALTDLFRRAEEAGRLHGLRLEGVWMHVGTPEAVAAAEAAILASAA
jgi:hypothetical protein